MHIVQVTKMNFRFRKRTIFLIAFVFLIVFAFTAGRTIVLKQIRAKLEEQIYKLRDNGYIVRYDSINIDWKKNAVQVHRLSVRTELDSSECVKPEFLSAKLISASGFSIASLVFKGHLKFDRILIDSPNFVINEKFLDKDTVKRNRKDFTILVEEIDLPSLSFTIYNSKTCNISWNYVANAKIGAFKLAIYEDDPMFLDIGTFHGDSIEVEMPDAHYRLSVTAINYKRDLQIFDLDTLRISPTLGKLAFGREHGYEIDRFDGVIPYVNLYGFDITRGDSLTLTAKKVTTQLFIKVFRDKRLPFKRKFKPLPIAALNALPVGVRIDSVILNKSYVEYEEFLDGSDSSGRVFFKDLYATVRSIDNTDPERKGTTRLVATANLMGQGKIKVNVDCPWNTTKQQTVRGKLENFDMRNMNEMIEPAIQVSAESGRLNSLTFNFSHSQNHARGELELNYNDLKLVAFKNENRLERIIRRKERKGDHDAEDDENVRKAALKSFLLNTFVVKKDRDKDVPESKRTGTIDFERDQAKSIFNFWWKSLLSGIKSAYNIDKIEDSKITGMLRKKDKG